jgi:hypothetical protein
MRDGSIRFQSSYDPILVDELKNGIPWLSRKWNERDKAWYIDIDYAQNLIEIVRSTLGIEPEIQGNLFVATQVVPEIKLIKLEYLGTAKDRGGNEPTAFGWVDGSWNAIFPLSILKQWFNFQNDDPAGAPTLYAVLGVSTKVSGADLKKAWRRAARQWHPDVNREPDAKEQFQRIQAAYEALSNPLTRRKYDAGLSFQVQTIKNGTSGMLEKHSWWYPPFRCGWLTIEGIDTLGRINVTKIVNWQDIKRGNLAMVSYWPKGGDHFKVRWV